MKKTLAMALTGAWLAGSALAANDYVILEMGDREIKKSQVQTIWSALFPAGQAPDFDSVEEPIKQNVLRGAVSEYILYEEALDANVDENPKVLARIEDAKRKLIVRQFIDDKTQSLVKDDEVRAEYDKQVRENRDKEEVRARHILVDDEDKAKELKAKLDDGADFEELAKEHSKDPGSKVQGGDLGYFAEGQMVAEFSKAAFVLKKGEVSEPVKSDFGWHVIKLVDRRKMTAPTFSEIQEQIKAKLVETRLNDYVNKLVDQTEVKYFDADGKEKDFTKVPDSGKKDG